MKITKEASTFYFTFALLKASKHYMQYLISSSAVAQSLKFDLKVISNKIGYLERVCNRSLDGADAQSWRREWIERDYEVFANVLGIMNDMDEKRRAVLEEFAMELSKGSVRVEIENH